MASQPPTVLSRTDALVRIAHVIETAETLNELLTFALEELARLFDAPYSAIALMHDDRSAASIACEHPPHAGNTTFQRAETPLLQRILHEPLGVRITASTPPDALVSFLRDRTSRDVVAVPLVAQGQQIGFAVIAASGKRRVPEQTLAMARVLAGQLAAAIVALQTSAAARRRSEELFTLNEIASTVTSTLDPHEVYLLVVQKLNQYFKVDAGSILLADTQNNLRFVMTIEGGEEKLAGITVPAGQGVVGYVANTGEWAIVADAENDPRFYREVSESVGYQTKSILCVPMVAKGRVIGVIELLNKLDGNFTEEDADRLTRMAAFIGVALENARLFQQVADGRDRLAAILDSTADGIMMADNEGIVRSGNPMACRIFGVAEYELLGQPIEDLLAQLRERAHQVQRRGWSTGDGTDAPEDAWIEVELGGQRRRFIRYIRLPVRDEAGTVYGQLALLRDVTQEKELEQLREDYTGMLVHDLRAPLTSIMNGITMVQRGLGGPVTEQQHELLNIAQMGSQTMLELVNNLLDISKMEEGRMPLDPEPQVPYAIIDAAIDRLGSSARARGITVRQELAVGLPTIEADGDKIIRVLQNLLDNAFKFSPSNAPVIVGAYHHYHGSMLPEHGPQHPPIRDGDWLVIWVRDYGPGIPAAYHERIFEKFGQVLRGNRLRGTGLGLTFCKLAVEAHQGQIWLESREGMGSTFAFALPLLEMLAPAI